MESFLGILFFSEMTTSFPQDDTHQHSSWSCPCLNFIIGLFCSITLLFISTSVIDDTDEPSTDVDAAPDSKPPFNNDKTSNVTSAINSEQQGTHTSIKRVDLRSYQ